MDWYNDITKLFMSRGYLKEGQTIDEKIEEIVEHSANILKQGLDYKDKLRKYIKRGDYVIPTPVWKNFYKESNESPISCVVGDTWINTDKGGKQAKDIEIGDLVLTHKNRFKKVIDVIPSKQKGDIYKLKVGTRMTNLYITGNHVVLTNLGWLRVDELDAKKHLIAVNGELEYDAKDYTLDLTKYVDHEYVVEDGLIKHPTRSYFSEIRKDVELTNDLAWAFGLWFAEGSISTNDKKLPNGIRVTLNAEDKNNMSEKWLKIMSASFNLNGGSYESKVERNRKTSVNINSNVIGRLFDSFGKGCKEKEIPQWILELPKEKLEHFLEGILSGDGTFRRNEVKITLANPKLILQVYNIGLKLNHSMSLQMQEKAGKLYTTSHVYTLIFREYINSVSVNSASAGIKFNDNLVYCPIRTLEKTERVEDVYDFTVEEDHSFSCAGVVVHNCFGVALEDSVESIVIKSAEVALQNKIGGGSSGTFQNVRGRGASISNNQGKSNGSVSMMEIYQTMSGVISQPNRRGHFSATQDIEHPDVIEFLKSRTDGHVLQDISTGVKISNKFIEKLLNGDEEAMDIMKLLIKMRYKTGFPYIFFTENVNNNTVDVYKDKNMTINHSNMCVTGDQLVVTDKGLRTVLDLYNSKEDLVLFDGEKPVNASPMRLIEENVNVFEILTKSGKSHKVTDYHKIKTTRGMIECKDLKIGEKVYTQRNKGLFGSDEVKGIPLTSPETVQRAFIDDLFKEGNEYWDNNIEFLRIVQIILANLGIDAKVSKNKITITDLPEFDEIESITFVGTEDVYCTTVDTEEHVWVCNSFITSNCQEIALPNSRDETFVCNLLGMNILNYDLWKEDDSIEIGIHFMDSMLTDFIDKTKAKKEGNEDYYNVLYKPAVTFAERHRAMGMGMSGLHSYLQSKMIPFDSLLGKAISKEVAKTIHDKAYKASEKMAITYGKPELLQEEKYKRRHTTLLAVAPNTSSAFILGQQSQSIEPFVSNYYIKDVAKIRKSFRNPYLEQLLIDKGQSTEDVWLSILRNNGSVQHLPFLSDNEKNVFRTFSEIPQLSIIDMAADRQKFIDQSQSLNLMVGSNIEPAEVLSWILYAWKKGVKTLYYQLNVNTAQDFTNKRSCESCEA